MSSLLANRECGECTECCKWLPIDDVGLQKQANVVCQHCEVGSGCRIYESRPQPCRDWYCGWRILRQFDESWRPDRSGIIIEFEDRDIPPAYRAPGIRFFLVGPFESILKPGFAEAVGVYVEARVATFISIPGPVGHFPAKLLVNELVEPAVARRDRDLLLATLLDGLEILSRQEFDPVVLQRR